MCLVLDRVAAAAALPFSEILLRREQDSDFVGRQQSGHDGREAGLHLAAGGILRQTQGERIWTGYFWRQISLQSISKIKKYPNDKLISFE